VQTYACGGETVRSLVMLCVDSEVAITPLSPTVSTQFPLSLNPANSVRLFLDFLAV
jgi:hypothetical protein